MHINKEDLYKSQFAAGGVSSETKVVSIKSLDEFFDSNVVVPNLPELLNGITYLNIHIIEMTCLIKNSDISKDIKNDILRHSMPYHFILRTDGTIMPLNREYLPLGVRKCANVSVDYNHCTLYNTKVRLDNVKLPLYLYNDSNAPWISKKDFNRYINQLYSFLCMN